MNEVMRGVGTQGGGGEERHIQVSVAANETVDTSCSDVVGQSMSTIMIVHGQVAELSDVMDANGVFHGGSDGGVREMNINMIDEVSEGLRGRFGLRNIFLTVSFFESVKTLKSHWLIMTLEILCCPRI